LCFFPANGRRWNIGNGFSAGNESLFGCWKARAQDAETSNVKLRFFEPENTLSHSEADYAALTVFHNLDAKPRRGKRTPKPRKGNGEPKKIVFEVDRKTCSRAWHSNALSRHAQVAIAERQHGERNAKRRKRRSPKRQTNRWKMEREAPQHRLGTCRNTHYAVTVIFLRQQTHWSLEERFDRSTVIGNRTQHPEAIRTKRRMSEDKHGYD